MSTINERVQVRIKNQYSLQLDNSSKKKNNQTKELTINDIIKLEQTKLNNHGSLVLKEPTQTELAKHISESLKSTNFSLAKSNVDADIKNSITYILSMVSDSIYDSNSAALSLNNSLNELLNQFNPDGGSNSTQLSLLQKIAEGVLKFLGFVSNVGGVINISNPFGMLLCGLNLAGEISQLITGHNYVSDTEQDIENFIDKNVVEPFKKDVSDMITKSLEDLGVSTSDAVKIGDTVADIIGVSLVIGLITVGINSGVVPPKLINMLAGPVVKHLNDRLQTDVKQLTTELENSKAFKELETVLEQVIDECNQSINQFIPTQFQGFAKDVESDFDTSIKNFAESFVSNFSILEQGLVSVIGNYEKTGQVNITPFEDSIDKFLSSVNESGKDIIKNLAGNLYDGVVKNVVDKSINWFSSELKQATDHIFDSVEKLLPTQLQLIAKEMDGNVDDIIASFFKKVGGQYPSLKKDIVNQIESELFGGKDNSQAILNDLNDIKNKLSDDFTSSVESIAPTLTSDLFNSLEKDLQIYVDQKINQISSDIESAITNNPSISQILKTDLLNLVKQVGADFDIYSDKLFQSLHSFTTDLTKQLSVFEKDGFDFQPEQLIEQFKKLGTDELKSLQNFYDHTMQTIDQDIGNDIVDYLKIECNKEIFKTNDTIIADIKNTLPDVLKPYAEKLDKDLLVVVSAYQDSIFKDLSSIGRSIDNAIYDIQTLQPIDKDKFISEIENNISAVLKNTKDFILDVPDTIVKDGFSDIVNFVKSNVEHQVSLLFNKFDALVNSSIPQSLQPLADKVEKDIGSEYEQSLMYVDQFTSEFVGSIDDQVDSLFKHGSINFSDLDKSISNFANGIENTLVKHALQALDKIGSDGLHYVINQTDTEFKTLTNGLENNLNMLIDRVRDDLDILVPSDDKQFVDEINQQFKKMCDVLFTGVSGNLNDLVDNVVKCLADISTSSDEKRTEIDQLALKFTKSIKNEVQQFMGSFEKMIDLFGVAKPDVEQVNHSAFSTLPPEKQDSLFKIMNKIHDTQLESIKDNALSVVNNEFITNTGAIFLSKNSA